MRKQEFRASIIRAPLISSSSRPDCGVKLSFVCLSEPTDVSDNDNLLNSQTMQGILCVPRVVT